MQLAAMFNLDQEDEPDHELNHLEDMAILDKMAMWSSKVTQEYPVIPSDDLFEGVKDDEEDTIDQSELSGYHKIILSSPAYEWFLTSVAKESILKLETAQPRIRRYILDKLPTGTISKRQTLDIHQVTIDLEWHHSMEERLRYELAEEPTAPIQPYQKSIIMTGSPREAQGLTIKQYLAQTWPITGVQMLNILKTATTNSTQQPHGRFYTQFYLMLCLSAYS